jgi:hypothetical protein
MDLSSQDSLLQRLDSISKKLDDLTKQQPTYASITASKSQSTENPKSTIVIKPINLQQIPKLASTLQSLKPPKGITLTKLSVQHNAIELRTSTEPAKESLKEFLKNNLPGEVPIKDKSPTSTKIILFNVPEDTTEEDLQLALNAKLGTQHNTINVTLLKRVAARREGCETWTAQLARRPALMLLNSTYILLGMRKVYYRRYVTLRRCTKCQLLGQHSASSCQSTQDHCSLCGNFHHHTECSAVKLHCINCYDYNKKAGPDEEKVDTEHSTASNSCPTYKYYLNKLITENREHQ